jgi:acyl-CoA reductase-like NAD-dependent aldehyde dehydrogenase
MQITGETILSNRHQVISAVGQSNRKDIRNAVEAAQKAQPGWAKRSGTFQRPRSRNSVPELAKPGLSKVAL